MKRSLTGPIVAALVAIHGYANAQQTQKSPEQTAQPVAQQRQAGKQKNAVVNLSDTIIGNQEQPTVLYIVPWKPAEDTTILYLPLSPRTMENLFGHVERIEHRRQNQYINELDDQ